MSVARFIFAVKHSFNPVFDSTPKTRLCSPMVTGRASFSGGGADTRIVSEPVRPAAILLRPKQGKHIHRHHAAGLARGRNLFAGGIYA